MSNRKYVPESIQAYIVPSGDAHQVRRQSDMIDGFFNEKLTLFLQYTGKLCYIAKSKEPVDLLRFCCNSL